MLSGTSVVNGVANPSWMGPLVWISTALSGTGGGNCSAVMAVGRGSAGRSCCAKSDVKKLTDITTAVRIVASMAVR
jgi:hypothetical protein